MRKRSETKQRELYRTAHRLNLHSVLYTEGVTKKKRGANIASGGILTLRRDNLKHITCPNCGSNLDYGERCDCESETSYTSNSTYREDTNNPSTEERGADK